MPRLIKQIINKNGSVANLNSLISQDADQTAAIDQFYRNASWGHDKDVFEMLYETVRNVDADFSHLLPECRARETCSDSFKIEMELAIKILPFTSCVMWYKEHNPLSL